MLVGPSVVAVPGQEAAVEVDEKGVIDVYGLVVVETAAGARGEGRRAQRGETSEAFDGINIGVFLRGGEGRPGGCQECEGEEGGRENTILGGLLRWRRYSHFVKR